MSAELVIRQEEIAANIKYIEQLRNQQVGNEPYNKKRDRDHQIELLTKTNEDLKAQNKRLSSKTYEQ